MKAKVAHVYGWTDREISRMNLKIFYQYYISITPIEAESAIMGIKIASYTSMKQSDRKSFLNTLKRLTKQCVNNTGGRLLSYKEVVGNLSRKIKNG